MTWTVPSGGWRGLSNVQLRLRDLRDGNALTLLTFDEANNSFSVESTPAAGDDPVNLVLTKCRFQTDGSSSPTVTVYFTFVFNAARRHHDRFALDVAASDDNEAFSGFTRVGEFHVHKKRRRDDR